MWEPDCRRGRKVNRRSFGALVVAFALLMVTELWAPAGALAATSPTTTCRVRHVAEDPEAFAVVVAQQRADHLDGSFRRDAVYNELVVDQFVVPTDLSRFIDQPISLGPVSGGAEWGYRVHPIYRRTRFHNGLDAAAPARSPVHAMAEGTVLISAYRGGYGQLVALDHGDGFATLYAHLSHRDVVVGDVVEAGDVVGLIGSTGTATGPHLHFETRLSGVPVDPRWFIPVLATPAEPTGSTRVPEWAVVPGGEAAEYQIARLYLAAFGRLPDEQESAHWVAKCAAGATLASIAAVAVTDARVIERVGLLTPDELLARSESPEYQQLLADHLLQPEVRRLYLAVLGREPDASGVYHWADPAARKLTLIELAAAIGDSDEYAERFGDRTDREFLEQLYELLFDRAPDDAGLAYWLDRMANEGRWAVLVGFTESNEGRARLG